MAWIDIAIIVIFALSVVVSLLRGFIREVVSLATWITAIWLAFRFSDALAGVLPAALDRVNFTLAGTDFDIDNMRIGVAFVLIFLGTLIVGAIVNHLLTRLTRIKVLKASDRLLGALFGIVRGAVMVVVLVLIAGLTNFPHTTGWERAQLLPPFERGAVWSLQFLPARYAQYFDLRPVTSHA